MGNMIVRSLVAMVMLAVMSFPAFTSTTGPRADWKAFVSKSLQVVLDYPSDWSVTESPTGAVFTAPDGATVLLGAIDTGVLSPEEFQLENQLPNTRCASSMNRHGLTVRFCFDTVSFAYAADFVIRPPRGTPRLLALAMGKRGDLQVFRAMIESLRPAW